MAQNRYLTGLLLGFLSFALFTFSDASVKLVAGGVTPYESAFFGGVFGLLALPFVKGNSRWSDIFRTVNRPLWFVRFFSLSFGTICSVTAFTHLSMPEAFAIIFLQPAFVTLMSMGFLKEKIHLPRWAAVVIGFIGVLVVLRPGLRPLSIGHLAAVMAGLSGALSVVIFRAVGDRETKISLFGAGTVGSILVCGIIMAPTFTMPTPRIWGCLASYGLLAAAANIVLMYAARKAPASLIGPSQYSQMLWALMISAMIFHDHLDTMTYVGIVLIIGSGLLTLVRERQRGVALPPSVVGNPHAPAAINPRPIHPAAAEPLVSAADVAAPGPQPAHAHR